MHYSKGNPSNLPYLCIVLFPQNGYYICDSLNLDRTKLYRPWNYIYDSQDFQSQLHLCQSQHVSSDFFQFRPVINRQQGLKGDGFIPLLAVQLLYELMSQKTGQKLSRLSYFTTKRPGNSRPVSILYKALSISNPAEVGLSTKNSTMRMWFPRIQGLAHSDSSRTWQEGNLNISKKKTD